MAVPKAGRVNVKALLQTPWAVPSRKYYSLWEVNKQLFLFLEVFFKRNMNRGCCRTSVDQCGDSRV